jgi:tRNA(Arg) A34 adenosine deaminase TadA
MNERPDFEAMLEVAIQQARVGLNEGGIPIGAAIFDQTGRLVGAGHNRRVQKGDPSLHGETDAFRNAGRQRSYRNLIYGDHTRSVLVLQWTGSAVWISGSSRWREREFSGWDRLASFPRS